MWVKNLLAVNGLLSVLCALTACAGHDGGGAPATPESSAAVPSSPVGLSSAVPSSAVPVPSAVPATGPATGWCSTPILSAALRPAGPAAGNRYAFLTLTNRSAAPCRVRGYVGLALIGPDGRPLPTRVVRLAPPAPASITLRPGGSASTRLHWSVVPGSGEPEHGPCRPVPDQVWVTPPDERSHLTIAWSLGQVCESGEISVTALTAGPG
jgi:Domain of unknown function (DUF4232)